MQRAFLVGLVAVVAGCQQMEPREVRAPADSAAGEIAFQLAGQNGAAVLVPVSINGEGPFDFVLDTGATMTCIDAALADRLQLPPLTGAMGMGAGATGSGRLRLVRIDSVRVAGASATGLPGCVLDLAHIQDVGFEADGLLGLNFLKPFRVTLDFERSVLILRAP